MALLLTFVATYKLVFAHFSAAVLDLVAIDIWNDFFATIAQLCDHFQAGWAISKVAFERAFMSTWKNILAGIVTSGLTLSAHDRGINLDCAARAIERLVRYRLARLALAHVAELVALVLPTR